jgi:hypothetical protein
LQWQARAPPDAITLALVLVQADMPETHAYWCFY